MKKNILGLLSLFLAIILFSFTPASDSTSRTDLVWFRLDPSGQLVNPTNGGIQAATVPVSYGCTNDQEIPCAYGYNADDLEDLGGGTFGMPDPSGGFDPYSDFEVFAEKQDTQK